MSESRKGHPALIANGRKVGAASKGRKYTGDALERIRAAAKRPERISRVVAGWKRAWSALPEEVKLARMARLHDKCHANPSSIERIVAAILRSLGVAFETQKRIGRYSADIYVPSRNLVIECDGKYWHRTEQQLAADHRRDAYMLSQGYAVMRLPEMDIRNGAFHERLLEAVA